MESKILEHQFDKRLESFAPCHSQSLLLADFTETHTLFRFKIPYKKNPRNKKTESIHEQHFVEWKNEGRKPGKN